MFSADGIIRSILKVLDIEPEEARDMVNRVVQSVTSVDDRLARIEAELGIEDEPESEGEENGAEVIGIESRTRS